MVNQIIDRKTVGIPGPVGDVTPEVAAALIGTIEARDEAQVLRDQAEVFAASTVALQDAAVAQLIEDPGSDTRARLDADFGSWVSVKSFGAVGDGIADETAAFNAAISYANSLNPGTVDAANVVGVTLFVPVGRYKITGQLTAFRKSGINLQGAGPDGSVLLLSYNGEAFRFGDNTSDLLVGGSVSDLKIEYLAAPGASATVFGVQYASRIIWKDLLLVNVSTFIDAGPSGRFASSLWLQNIRGYVHNSGRPFLRVREGAGLFGAGVQMFVGGVDAPEINRTSTMTTVAGTDAIRAGEGSWDTIHFTGSFFERFDSGLNISTAVETIVNNVFLTNCYFDYIRRWAISLDTNGLNSGIYGVRLSNNWYATWEEDAIRMLGGGQIRGVSISGGQVASAGTYGISIGGTVRDVRVEGIDIQGVNRRDMNTSGLVVIAGSHIQISNINAGHNSSWAGFAWQAYNGIYVVGGIDHYTITDCDLAGTAGAITLEPNAAGSAGRIVRNNRGVSYSGYQAISTPATNVVVTNTTGTMWDIHIHGGTVSAIQKNGQTISGMTSGHLHVGPGETFRITHSAAPSISRFVQA